MTEFEPEVFAVGHRHSQVSLQAWELVGTGTEDNHKVI